MLPKSKRTSRALSAGDEEQRLFLGSIPLSNRSVEMSGDEEQRLRIRPSLKAQSSFNNYPKWKDKVFSLCLLVEISLSH